MVTLYSFQFKSQLLHKQKCQLTQCLRYESVTQDLAKESQVRGSISTGGNVFLLNLFCSSLRKPLLPTLPTLYN